MFYNTSLLFTTVTHYGDEDRKEQIDRSMR